MPGSTQRRSQRATCDDCGFSPFFPCSEPINRERTGKILFFGPIVPLLLDFFGKFNTYIQCFDTRFPCYSITGKSRGRNREGRARNRERTGKAEAPRLRPSCQRAGQSFYAPSGLHIAMIRTAVESIDQAWSGRWTRDIRDNQRSHASMALEIAIGAVECATRKRRSRQKPIDCATVAPAPLHWIVGRELQEQ